MQMQPSFLGGRGARGRQGPGRIWLRLDGATIRCHGWFLLDWPTRSWLSPFLRADYEALCKRLLSRERFADLPLPRFLTFPFWPPAGINPAVQFSTSSRGAIRIGDPKGLITVFSRSDLLFLFPFLKTFCRRRHLASRRWIFFRV